MDPLKLAATARRNGLVLFRPSSSYMHATCAASLIANFGKPDRGSPDAAYGTVGHAVGEQWLRRALDNVGIDPAMSERIGETVRVDGFDVEITDEMLEYVGSYVEWCLALDGEHYVETRIGTDFAPVPDQSGTADHAAVERSAARRRLVITDLKMGREPVYPAEHPDDPRAIIDNRPNGNTQAMSYAYGFIAEYCPDFGPDDEVVIRIAQPRLRYFGEWRTTVHEIYSNFGIWINGRYKANLAEDRPHTASPKGCRWCKAKPECPAWLKMIDTLTDDVFEPAEGFDVIEGTFRPVEPLEIVSTAESIRYKVTHSPTIRPASLVTTEHLELVKLYRKEFERYFEEVDAELMRRASEGEALRHFKMVPGKLGPRKNREDMAEIARDIIGLTDDEIYKQTERSAVELTDLVRAKYQVTKKRAEEIVAPLVTRHRGQDTLAPIKDERAAIEDAGSVFDPVT